MKDSKHDELIRLTQITKMYIFIKNFISEWVQPGWDESLGTNY